MYGKIVKVTTANLVTIDYGTGNYEVRLIGIDIPTHSQLATRAARFVANLVSGRNARARFVGRLDNGQMLAYLEVDDPKLGLRDVGLDLVRCGLAYRAKDFDYKYSEMSKVEAEAQGGRPALCDDIESR